MKLSIITINYNNREGLQKTIDSIVSQTWRDFEWIVIDGGSTDGSKELIEKYQEHLAYWCSEPDKGIYNAMNKGIAKAKGDYLNFMNSGDRLYANDTLEKIFFQNIIEDIIYGNLNCIIGNYNHVSYFPKKLSLHYMLTRTIEHQASFIRTSLLKQKGYQEKYHIIADWVAFLSWFCHGASFKHIDVIVATYDRNGISSTAFNIINNEKEMMYNDLFGVDNRIWIEEMIKMQRFYEKYDCDDMQRAFRIKEYGGRKLRWLFHWMLRLLNKTF